MKKDRKPDSVVYDIDNGTYDAHLKPYATNVGAPVIKLENIGPWKNKGIHAVNAKISAEFEEIRKKYLASELPIIMVTAKNQVQDLVQGLNLGANDYLAKPFSKAEGGGAALNRYQLLELPSDAHLLPDSCVSPLKRDLTSHFMHIDGFENRFKMLEYYRLSPLPVSPFAG